MIEHLKYKRYEYILKTPKSVEDKMPVILFLHGAGTRSTSLENSSKNPFFSSDSLYGREE